MRIVYAPLALRDIDQILSHIDAQNATGARKVSLAIEVTIDNCSRFPRAAPRTDEPDVFRRPLVKFPYTIFYRLLKTRDAIEILRVIHSARVTDLGAIPDDN